jgi:hypothetical protein
MDRDEHEKFKLDDIWKILICGLRRFSSLFPAIENSIHPSAMSRWDIENGIDLAQPFRDAAEAENEK